MEDLFFFVPRLNNHVFSNKNVINLVSGSVLLLCLLTKVAPFSYGKDDVFFKGLKESCLWRTVIGWLRRPDGLTVTLVLLLS